MIICLAVITFVCISVSFLWLANKVKKRGYTYETAFCRDVRAKLGMFAYTSQVEANREKLKMKNTKF